MKILNKKWFGIFSNHKPYLSSPGIWISGCFYDYGASIFVENMFILGIVGWSTREGIRHKPASKDSKVFFLSTIPTQKQQQLLFNPVSHLKISPDFPLIRSF